MEYRSRTQIEVSILKATVNAARNNENSGSKHTEIMNKTAIPNVYLKSYIQILQQKGLIDYDTQRQVFRTTDKGIRYLNLNSEINNLLA